MNYKVQEAPQVKLFFNERFDTIGLNKIQAPVPELIKIESGEVLTICVNSLLVKGLEAQVYLNDREQDPLTIDHIAINVAVLTRSILPSINKEVGRVWASYETTVEGIVTDWNGKAISNPATVSQLRYNFFPGVITVGGQTIDLDKYQKTHTGIYGPTNRIAITKNGIQNRAFENLG